MLSSRSLISRIFWKPNGLTSGGNSRKNSYYDKRVIKTIYMKLEFPIIIKVVKKSFYKMVKSLKFMLQSQVSKWNNWLFNIINTFIYEMCFCNVKMPRVCCTDVKMTFPFAVINSIAVIIPAQNFLGRTSVIVNWQRELAEDFQKSFNLQNGNVLSNKFSSCFLILPRKWEDTN